MDDDPVTRSVLGDLVTALGCEAHWVSDSASALREVVQIPPDVVLLDILMPGLSGLDVLPSLRAVAPGVPIIMVSGTADADLARQTLKRGAFDYLVKPVDIGRLGEVLDLALVVSEPPTGER